MPPAPPRRQSPSPRRGRPQPSHRCCCARCLPLVGPSAPAALVHLLLTWKQSRTKGERELSSLVRRRPWLLSCRGMAATGSLFLQSVRPPRDWDDVDETATSITRARIFEAMARAVAERGYANTTVADVVSAGRISRRTFYEHFQDKEHCFVETYRIGCENGLAQIDAAVRALEEPDWRTRLWVSLETYLEILAAEPHFARVLLIDVLGAGPQALEMRERVLGTLRRAVPRASRARASRGSRAPRSARRVPQRTRRRNRRARAAVPARESRRRGGRSVCAR